MLGTIADVFAPKTFAPRIIPSAYGVCPDGTHDVPTALRALVEMMETSDYPVLVVDRTHAGQLLRYANATLRRLLGYERGELAGREWSSLFTQVGSESALPLMRNAMDTGNPINAMLRVERSGGEVLWLSARMYPIRRSAGLVTQYIGILHDVTNERRAREELEHRAYHDALTGLANRHLLLDRFEQARAQALRRSGSLAVVILDMNGFKLINDRFGHQAGDDLLRCVAARLAATVRNEDTVARLGGDEFVLLLGEEPNVNDSSRAVVERVARALGKPVVLDRQQLMLGCCAGMSRYPEDGSDLGPLLKAADAALYRAKMRAKRPARAVRLNGERHWVPLHA